MDIHNEIEKIIKYENASLCQRERKTEQAVEKIIKQIIYEYENNQYDFTKYTSISLNQMDKIRHIKSYEPFSCEETMCIYIKRLLDRKFHIKYPNRNEYVNSLFDMVNALKNMNDYSIFRFDFKNFFNSVSSEYVFYKYILNSSLERYQLEIIENFVKNTKFAYAGLNTSNIICEIIATHFDDVLKLKFRKIGLVFYRRYIDDGIIICNKQVGKSECIRIVNETIAEQEKTFINKLKKFFGIQIKVDYNQLSTEQQKALQLSWLMAQVQYAVLAAPILTQDGNIDSDVQTTLEGAKESSQKLLGTGC